MPWVVGGKGNEKVVGGMRSKNVGIINISRRSQEYIRESWSAEGIGEALLFLHRPGTQSLHSQKYGENPVGQ